MSAELGPEQKRQLHGENVMPEFIFKRRALNPKHHSLLKGLYSHPKEGLLLAKGNWKEIA